MNAYQLDSVLYHPNISDIVRGYLYRNPTNKKQRKKRFNGTLFRLGLHDFHYDLKYIIERRVLNIKTYHNEIKDDLRRILRIPTCDKTRRPFYICRICKNTIDNNDGILENEHEWYHYGCYPR